MIRTALKRAMAFVTEHNRITLLVMVLLTAVVVAGIPQLDTGSEAGTDEGAFEDLDRLQAAQYVGERYGTSRDDENRTVRTVYVWDRNGDALSKSSLLSGLYFQQNVSDDDAVAAVLHEDGIVGFENLVAKRAAGNPNATLDEQIDALQSTDEDDVDALVATTLAEDPRAARFLPSDHDSEQTSSSDRRILVAIDTDTSPEARSEATNVLYQQSEERSDEGFFALTEQAFQEYNEHFFAQMTQLVLPIALALILVVLLFSYRNLVDILVGMTGVALSIAWTFGIMGWIGVAAGLVSIIPVVLVTGLSIDFGFHVFNRYREQRGPDDGIRESMSRGTQLVATSLILVTVTAAIGFLSNVTNPLGQIRNLGISITLGVVSAFVIFLTVVPALKVSIDGLLERIGFDRRKRPLGHGQYLGPALRKSVTLARRAAPVVVVVAVVAGAAGGVAWVELDREQFDASNTEVAEWKQQLPGPLGWDSHEVAEQNAHVGDLYTPASADSADREPILVEGNVTADDTLEDLHAGVETIQERDEDMFVQEAGTEPVTSPVTAMQAVAAENETFAAVFDDADGDGNGVPDRNLEHLYDEFYAAAPDVASQVVERTDGEYRSVLVVLLVDVDYTDRQQSVATLEAGADVAEGDGDRTATLAGNNAIVVSILDELTEGVLLTMVVALSTILLVLSLVFRGMHGTASLGTVVALPILLVVGLVVGGMYLLGLPLNLLTALLMSLVIGLGVDYNIHLGDRFADELRDGKSTFEALDAAVTGTGGALLGSTLTSVGAFTTLILVPESGIQGFGTIVVVALATAFVVSVVVLPSVLVLWSRYGPVTAPVPDDAAAATADAGDD